MLQSVAVLGVRERGPKGMRVSGVEVKVDVTGRCGGEVSAFCGLQITSS